ncbi:hypothetical protein SteCoe_3012 [Stentor coeruleus]|uniref:Uncharacterized protein n=1 Tax=Stentor coeruleus TaxID=5963 RepID=A0A1R2CY72_9CILI|nr:hypothetical protein SteCoe_3012 [Stentor coeruleus]
MSLFRIVYKAHDYLKPYSKQLLDIQTVKTAYTAAEYSESVIKQSNLPNLDFDPCNYSRESIKIARLLNKDIILPEKLQNSILKDLIKHPSYTDILEPIIKGNLPNLNDEELATYCSIYNETHDIPLKHSPISSFEDLYYIIKWKSSTKLPKESLIWMQEQTYKLIYEDKIDLDYITKIYNEICKNIINFDDLWSIYNDIIYKYFFALIPEQIIESLKGFSSVKNKYFKNLSWMTYVETLDENILTEFSSLQLANLAKQIIDIGINLHPFIRRRLMNEKVIGSSDYIHCSLHLNLNVQSIGSMCEAIIENGSFEEKINIIKALNQYNKHNQVKEKVIKKLCEQLETTSFTDILELLKNVACTEQCSEVYEKCINQIEKKYIGNINIKELEPMSYVLGLYVHQELSIPLSFTKAFETILKVNIQSLNPYVYINFIHLFSYLFPYKSIHDILVDFLIVTDLPSYISDTKPDHEYYEIIGQGKYLVLNHPILSSMQTINLAIAVVCLKMKFQLPDKANNIIRNYIKVLIKNSFFKLNLKHRTKLGIMLAMPENFDKEIADLYFEQIKKTFLRKFRLIYTYSIVMAIINFKKIDYVHPIMDSILANSDEYQEDEDILS